MDETELFLQDYLTVFKALHDNMPLDSLSDGGKVQAIGTLFQATHDALKLKKELAVFDAQIAELEASEAYKARQTTALDDAVKRDTAKIVCEALGIIKSAGNNAGGWWGVASTSINALAGSTIASVTTDP